MYHKNLRFLNYHCRVRDLYDTIVVHQNSIGSVNGTSKVSRRFSRSSILMKTTYLTRQKQEKCKFSEG